MATRRKVWPSATSTPCWYRSPSPTFCTFAFACQRHRGIETRADRQTRAYRQQVSGASLLAAAPSCDATSDRRDAASEATRPASRMWQALPLLTRVWNDFIKMMWARTLSKGSGLIVQGPAFLDARL